MLNISLKRIDEKIDRKRLSSLAKVESKTSSRVLLRLFFIGFSLFFISSFLPWTQNVRSHGSVTTLYPDQRPQTIHSVIAGRIEKWHIKEGDFVKKGDTILFISEVKDDYFDPNLLSNTQQQLKSKELAVGAYMNKVKALDGQIDALMRTSQLKLEQAKNQLKQSELKVVSDSMDYQSTKVQYEIAIERLNRMEQLYKGGLKSLTDLEQRKLNLQQIQAEMISAENQLLSSQNKVINAKVELNSIQAQYVDEIAKSESDKYTAMSNMFDAEAIVTKLQNQYMNFSVRSGLYYIKAPQDGYIAKTLQSGLGETIKEGAEIVSIMPANYQLAVEMYIRPLDLPLIKKGQHVRIQFDGWPAIVFSGWPNTSYGTYGGEVIAIDNFISENGKYRLLLSPDPNDYEWPKALRVGSGTNNMILLEDVPIWYELWRQINGFPPDYYELHSKNGNEKRSNK